MGYLFENLNDSTHTENSTTKHVTFGKVQTYEYEKPEEKISFKKKIQGIFGNAMTIGNDENLKILIKNQNFWRGLFVCFINKFWAMYYLSSVINKSSTHNPYQGLIDSR